MLPQSYPNYKSVHRRFQIWCRDEVLRRVLMDVANELRDKGALDEAECYRRADGPPQYGLTIPCTAALTYTRRLPCTVGLRAQVWSLSVRSGPILVKLAEKIVFDPQLAAFWRWRHRRSPEGIRALRHCELANLKGRGVVKNERPCGRGARGDQIFAQSPFR